MDPIALLAKIEPLQDQLWQYAYVGRPVITATLALNGPPPEGLVDQSDQQRVLLEPPTPTAVSESTNQDQPADSPNGSDPTDTPANQPLERSARRHRRNKPKGKHQAPRWWRTRKDPFEDVWDELEQQLERTPDIYAKTLFHWLQEKYPGQFEAGQLRTLQRRVKAWRVEQTGRRK